MYKYQSNCEWPAFTLPGQDDTSTDNHHTDVEAQEVCDLLEIEGFRGEGQIFPVRTWISEIEDQ